MLVIISLPDLSASSVHRLEAEYVIVADGKLELANYCINKSTATTERCCKRI